MHRLAHGIISTIRERDVGKAAGGADAGAALLDFANRFDEIEGVAIVLLHAGGHGQDVGVKNNILRISARLFDEDFIGALADAHLIFEGGRLTFLVEGHDNKRRAVATA